MMDVKMSSLPSTGGTLPCASPKSPLFAAKPQVTLRLDVNPPVLDTSGVKSPTKSSSSSSSTNQGSGIVGGTFLNSIKKIYKNMFPGSPITWVNPDMVPEFHPVQDPSLKSHLGYKESNQHPIMNGGLGGQPPPVQPLWYQASDGSQPFHCQDPLQGLSEPLFKNSSPLNISPYMVTSTPVKIFYPNGQNGFHKSKQPLNPEAKEWVPDGYRNGQCFGSDVPTRSGVVPSEVNMQKPILIANVSVGYFEVTDDKVNKPNQGKNVNTTDNAEIFHNKKNKEFLMKGSDTVVVDSDNANNCEHKLGKPSDQNVDDNGTSYATIVKNTDERYQNKKTINDKVGLSPTERVRPSMPKVILQDKRYPKEKAPLLEWRRTPPPHDINDKVRSSPIERVRPSMPKVILQDKRYPKEKAPLLEWRRTPPPQDNTRSFNRKYNKVTGNKMDKLYNRKNKFSPPKNKTIPGAKSTESENVIQGSPIAQMEILSDSSPEKESAFSYASITRKSPNLSPNVKSENDGENLGESPNKCVKQPLPKIFVKDQNYPKEKASPILEKRREPLPFKTASVNQKKCSRKFLKELKELSPAKSDCSVSSVASSIDSSDLNVVSRLSFIGSPSLCQSSPKERTKLTRSNNSNIKSHNGSETCDNNSNRTMSESSATSGDSIEIEFGDDGNNNADNSFEICFVANSPKGSSKKCQNSILAHILGLDDSDSDSDESDDDDDSDWDEIDASENCDLDESWETFGLNIPLITTPSSEKPSEKDTSDNDICDSIYFNVSLDDINHKWEENVGKDLKTTTPTKVNFGNATVRPMVTWSYAYKNARRGPWEQMARDRSRFRNRIASLDSVLSPVLQGNHRMKMYSKIYES